MGYFTHLMDVQYAEKHDLYMPMVCIQFVALVLMIFGWSAFTNQQDIANASTTAALSNNTIPAQLLLYLLGQFILILVDRIIYLSHSLRSKIILQFVLAISLQILVFVILPITTNRSFLDTPMIIAWYVVMFIYLTISGYQIRYSYPNCILRQSLTQSYGDFASATHAIYMAIPFLSEIRMCIDWACTPTTLSLASWFKMEDVYNQLYSIKSTLIDEVESGRQFGQPRPKSKTFKGLGIAFALIVLVWCPLLIMSLLNSVTVSNPCVSASFQMTLNAYDALFVGQTVSISTITGQDYNVLHDYLVDQGDYSGFLSSFQLGL